MDDDTGVRNLVGRAGLREGPYHHVDGDAIKRQDRPADRAQHQRVVAAAAERDEDPFHGGSRVPRGLFGVDRVEERITWPQQIRRTGESAAIVEIPGPRGAVDYRVN